MIGSTSNHFSWRFLAVTFVLALVLFVGLRWDINPWLKGKLDNMIQQQHLDLHYATLERDGLHVTLHQVQFKHPSLPQTLQLDRLDVAPDIWASLTGHRRADVHVQNDFMDIRAQAEIHKQMLTVQGLEASWDVAQSQAWLALPSPIHVQGQLHMEGQFSMDMDNGLPQSATLTAHWQQAEASLMSQHYPLGDYILQANIENQHIQWQLSGGQELALQGKGWIEISNLAMSQWALQGHVTVLASQKSSLAMFLTASERQLNISGSVEHPQWKF